MFYGFVSGFGLGVAMASTQFKALDAITGTAIGSVRDLGSPMPIHSMQVVHTGSPTVVVGLEGSLDGVNFDILVTWDSGVQANGDMVTASAFSGTGIKAYPVIRYVRANCTTFTGGTNPTLTAQIASFGS